MATEISIVPRSVRGLTYQEGNLLSDQINAEEARKERGMKQLSEFHPFPKLPIEIRLAIWKLSLPGPRFVEMRIPNNRISLQFDFVSSHDYRCTGANGVGSTLPTILWVCHEARTEALKSYTLAFHHPKFSIPVYIDFRIDTLCLRQLLVSERSFSQRKVFPREVQFNAIIDILPDKDKVKKLAVQHVISDHRKTDKMPYIFQFSALREVFVLDAFDRDRGYRHRHHHLRHCHEGRSCFPKVEDLYGGYGNSHPGASEHSQYLMSGFLEDWKANKFGFRTWQEPSFRYQALYQEGIFESHDKHSKYTGYCPSSPEAEEKGRREENTTDLKSQAYQATAGMAMTDDARDNDWRADLSEDSMH